MLEGSSGHYSSRSPAPASAASPSTVAPEPSPPLSASAKYAGPSFTAINPGSPPPTATTTTSTMNGTPSSHGSAGEAYAQPRPPTAGSSSGAAIELVRPPSRGRDEHPTSKPVALAAVKESPNLAPSSGGLLGTPTPPTWSAAYNAHESTHNGHDSPPTSTGEPATVAAHAANGAAGMMGSVPTSTAPAKPKKKPAGSACNSCHRLKTRCSGGHPCDRCASHKVACEFDRTLVYRSPVASTGPLGSSSRKGLGGRVSSGLAVAAAAPGDEDDEIDQDGLAGDDEDAGPADDASSNGAAAAAPKKRKVRRPRASIDSAAHEPAAQPASSYPSAYPQQYPPTYPPSLLHTGSPSPHSGYGPSLGRSAAFHAQHANLAIQGPAAVMSHRAHPHAHSPAPYGHHIPQHMPPPSIPYGGSSHYRRDSNTPAGPHPPEPGTSQAGPAGPSSAVEERLASLEKSVSSLLDRLEKRRSSRGDEEEEDDEDEDAAPAKKKARTEEPRHAGISNMTLPRPVMPQDVVVSDVGIIAEHDPISLGIISEAEAHQTFRCFTERCLHFLRVLDSPSFESVRCRCPLLFSAILTIGSRFRHPRKPPKVAMVSLTSRLVGDTVLDRSETTAGQKLDAARALVLLAGWPATSLGPQLNMPGVDIEGKRTNAGWLLAGHAMRLARIARETHTGGPTEVRAAEAVLLFAQSLQIFMAPSDKDLRTPPSDSDEFSSLVAAFKRGQEELPIIARHAIAFRELADLFVQVSTVGKTKEGRATVAEDIATWSKDWLWAASAHIHGLGPAARELRLIGDALLVALLRSGEASADDGKRAEATATAAIQLTRDDAREGGSLAYGPDFVKDTVPVIVTSLLELVKSDFNPPSAAKLVDPAVASHFVRMALEVLQACPNGDCDKAADRLQLLAAQTGLQDFEALGALQSLSESGSTLSRL